jgi:TPR repeat protein/Flp pilus assembly protein TadD
MLLPNWLSPVGVWVLFSPKAAVRRAAALTAAGKPAAAFRFYVRAARSGLAEAEYRIGRCYLEGAGVPPSRAEAVRWLEQAGRRAHVEAQSLLAMLHLHGAAGRRERSAAGLFDTCETTDPDYRTAAFWARTAAEGGSADGQAVLAYILTSGPEDMRDLAEAELWYERSAAAGCPQGRLGHALALARKGGDEAVQREVAAQLEKAAEAGLPLAFYLLGVISEQGLGVARDQVAAAHLYRCAAEAGDRAGQARWGLALLRGLGVDADPCAGETWLRRAALAGDAEAAVVVGDLYAGSGNLPPNHAEAAQWFRRAAEAGHSGAARALGLLHLTGRGVAPDPEEAVQWFRIAAAAGDPTAQAELGNLVLKGFGGQDDRLCTCRWFAQAADAGDPVAAFNYGVCLARGIGVSPDDAQAAFWLRKAADRVVSAQYWYGRLLIEGRGVARDVAGGRAWIARAAEGGLPDAQAALGEMMLNGSGGRRDPCGALALLEKAAAQGHVGAMFATALIYRDGHHVSADQMAAQRWFRAAAERGHAKAQIMLGRYLARSLAGEHDPERAHYWLEQALAQGQTEAAEELTALSRGIAPNGSLQQLPDQFAAHSESGERAAFPLSSLACEERGLEKGQTDPEIAATESAMEPRQDTSCACGSGLRSRRCCDLDPDWLAPAEASEQINLLAGKAAAALAGGNMAAAETLCLNVLDIAPRLPGALWTLYQIRRRAGQEQAATVLLQRLVALAPNNVEATQELAALLFERGDLVAAEQHARNAVRLAPAHSRSHNLMGMILTEAQRPQVGEFHYRRVLELSGARDPIVLANLAWNLKSQGRLAEARHLYQESVETAPDVFQTRFGWAQLEEADRDFAAARSQLDRAAELRPDDPGLRVARARLLTREGKYGAALAELEPDPNGAENAALAPVRSDPSALLEKGRVLDRLGRYDEAFACFAEGKQRAREATGKTYLEREARESVERLRQFFVADRLRLMPQARMREECPQPIFILGFPRSGTTLAEQILAGHPRISAGDELPFINELGDALPRLLGSPLPYPEALSELWMGDNRLGLETLRDFYLQKVETRGIVKPGSAWFTDKMPLNETHLGLIALTFPRSPLIHILRHPLDVVLSVFSYHLTHGYFCAAALETIARHYVLVMELVQHYRAEIALRYLPVRYEDMVEDMTGNVRRILDFIGEPFDEHCVNFQENRRLPHTPSYMQVAEPLYRRSRFRYRHYLRHLEPVIPILQPIMDRLGYSLDQTA